MKPKIIWHQWHIGHHNINIIGTICSIAKKGKLLRESTQTISKCIIHLVANYIATSDMKLMN